MTMSSDHIPLFYIEDDDRCIEVDSSSCKTYFNDHNNNTDSFKVFHLNVCSINKNFNQVQVLLKIINVNPDIIILSEARLVPNLDLRIFDIEGYDMYHTVHHYRQNDGVVAYIRSDLKHECKEMLIKDSNCLALNVNKNNKLFSGLAFYRSPNGDLNHFLEKLPNLLSSTIKPNSIHFVTGDININIIGQIPHQNHDYLNIMTSAGLISILNKPTREKNCIDHMFITNKDIYKTEVLLLPKVTDHCPAILNYTSDTQENNTPRILQNKSTVQKINFEQLKNDLNKEKWTHILSSTDPNEAVTIFTSTLRTTIEKNTTTEEINRTKTKSPWITKGLIKCFKVRDKLHLQCKQQPFNTRLLKYYKQYRNKLTTIIKKAKNQYFSKQIDKAEGDKRKIYNTINEAIHYKSKRKTDPTQIKINDKIITDQKLIADHLNTHYINVGQRLSNNTNNLPNPILRPFTIDCSLFLKPITPKEVENTINKLRGESAPGHDNIKVSTLKKINQQVSKPLSHIFNLCIKNGIYPTSFKKSIIRPVYKKGDVQLTVNYRPISLTTAFSKIFERCIKKRFSKYINENSILFPTQYGFREGKNTTDAILEVTESVHSSLDNGELAAVVFMDLSKAFDMVDHTTLHSNFKEIGLDGVPLQLFESYLADRSQQVKLNNILSEEMKAGPFSTPQGTVLSPIFYNVYVKNLNRLPINGKLISYADDTALCIKGKNWNEIFENIQNEMQIIINWFNIQNLKLNVDKTKIVAFSHDKRKLPTVKNIQIHTTDCTVLQRPCSCESIEIVTSCRYLGVEIDCHLKWDRHIDLLTNRLRKMIYPFLILRDFLNLRLLKNVYFALVQSALEYGICAYGRADDTHLKKLKTTQNTILKIIYKKHRLFNTERLYKDMEILNINKLFHKNICYHIHKYKDNLIQYTEHNYSLRQRNANLPRPFSSKGTKTIRYLGVKIFNQLPEEIKAEEKRDLFKILVKRWLHNNQINVFAS